MIRKFGGTISSTRNAAVAVIRRPEWLVFLPAISLAAFWLGGESALIITALGLPLVLGLLGAQRGAASGGGIAVRPAQDTSLSLRNHVVDTLDEILRDTPFHGKSTACLVLQFDGADQLLAR
ncbi:MAG: diguanylate cyclase, partial [Cypionkella sp.]